MTSSVPLSLLAKGIGQVSKNGHERLDVFLEAEDYYNLESKYQRYQKLSNLKNSEPVDSLLPPAGRKNEVPLHKTFITRKGALLLFAEELANKTNEEESGKEAKKKKNDEEDENHDLEDPALKTCHDLSWAILNYGTKPVYRRRGDELYLRFLHDPNGAFSGRRIRPGFSPKRYISTWSKYWDDGVLQKLRTNGLISDKTLFRQNPLMPHLYKNVSYNLSSIPPPYRVTKNMLLAPGAVPSYEFYRVKMPSSSTLEALESESKAPPPSETGGVKVVTGGAKVVAKGGIQAVKYHESGDVQEVVYADLRPQEKQQILAELLIAAHEHQQNIRETLNLVISQNRPPGGVRNNGSSEASSELMADMHRAIANLVESPVRQQMRERQKLLEEQEEREMEKRRRHEAREEEKKKRRLEKKLRKRQISEKKEERVEKEEGVVVVKKEEKVDKKEQERREKEERRAKRREEREKRKREKEERLRELEKKEKEEKDAEKERPPFRDEPRQIEDKEERRKHRHRRHKEDKHEKREEMKKSERSHQQPQIEDKHRKKSRRGENVVVEAPGYDIIEGVDEVTDQTIVIVPPQSGIAEIKRRDPRSSIPTQAPANTPATRGKPPKVGTRSRGFDPGVSQVGSEEALLRRRGSHASTISEADDVTMSPRRRKSAESSSSGPKQKLFAPMLPGGETNNSSFYGGSMPITSNLVKQTLPDKVSMLSASQDSGSVHSKASRGQQGGVDVRSKGGSRRASPKVAQLPGIQVPMIGVEPATPLRPQPQVTPQPPSLKSLLPPSSPRSGHSLRRRSSKDSGGQRSTGASERSLGQSERSLGQSERSRGQSERSRGQSERSLGQSVRSRGQSERSYDQSEGSKGQSERSRSPSERSFDERSDKGQRSIDRRSQRSSGRKKPEDDGEDSDQSDQSQSSKSSEQSKSVKHEVVSKSSQTISSKTKSKKSSFTGSFSEELEKSYVGLKGAKGPGSQSSSSFLKSSTLSSKSRGGRGSVPRAMKLAAAASLKMPDGEVVTLGGSLAHPSVKEESDSESVSSELSKSSIESVKSPEPVLPNLNDYPKTPLKSSKSSRRVSFQDQPIQADDVISDDVTEEEEGVTSQDEIVTSQTNETETEESEEEEEGNDWPMTAQEKVASVVTSSGDSRPISSRSEKLTEHAQKVAALVAGSGSLDEDASEAASIWNDEIGEEEEESEEEEEDSWGKQAEAVKKMEEQAMQPSEPSVKEEVVPKEVTPRARVVTKKVPSVKSTSSESTISSAQESFVHEIQRKASDLGIDEAELEFEAEVVGKVADSSIRAEDVVVVHEGGKHVVRSRRSSVTASSVLTSASEQTEHQRTQRTPSVKQTIVVELPDQSAGASRASSVTTSVASSRSSSYSPERRRASIQAEQSDVQLDYDVTAYEGKLGDPKPVETIQKGPRVEPEKMKKPEQSKQTKEQSKQSKEQSTHKQLANKPVTSQSKAVTSQNKAVTSQNKAVTSQNKAVTSQNKTMTSQNKTMTSLKKEADSESLRSDRSSTKVSSKGKPPTKNQPKKKRGKMEEERSEEKLKAEKKVSKSEKTKEEEIKSSSPEKRATKSPATSFLAGRAKEAAKPSDLKGVSPKGASPKAGSPGGAKGDSPVEKAESEVSLPKKKKERAKKKDPVTQVEVDREPKKSPSPPKVDKVDDAEQDEEEDLPPLPAESPEDDYDFVIKDDTPTPEPPKPPTPPVVDDLKSVTSEVTELTENTETSSQALLAAQEEEADREAKKAAKQEREQKRAVQAEKRKAEVERKRREKEEQMRKEKEELERREQMKDALEQERRNREDAARKRKEDAEKEKMREREEEELRERRIQQQRDREKKQEEEYRRKLEEVARRKKEEEMKKRELARIKAEEEEQKRKEEEELMAQMEDSERRAYEEAKRAEAEERRAREEERRRREEEEARTAMELARVEAVIRAKQQAELEEKLRFVREFLLEANGLDQTQLVNRGFTFSYFELMTMLGLDVVIE